MLETCSQQLIVTYVTPSAHMFFSYDIINAGTESTRNMAMAYVTYESAICLASPPSCYFEQRKLKKRACGKRKTSLRIFHALVRPDSSSFQDV